MIQNTELDESTIIHSSVNRNATDKTERMTQGGAEGSSSTGLSC
jgi:hypothetical protein